MLAWSVCWLSIRSGNLWFFFSLSKMGREIAEKWVLRRTFKSHSFILLYYKYFRQHVLSPMCQLFTYGYGVCVFGFLSYIVFILFSSSHFFHSLPLFCTHLIIIIWMNIFHVRLWFFLFGYAIRKFSLAANTSNWKRWSKKDSKVHRFFLFG